MHSLKNPTLFIFAENDAVIPLEQVSWYLSSSHFFLFCLFSYRSGHTPQLFLFLLFEGKRERVSSREGGERLPSRLTLGTEPNAGLNRTTLRP